MDAEFVGRNGSEFKVRLETSLRGDLSGGDQFLDLGVCSVAYAKV